MRLSDYLRPALVQTDLVASGVEGVVREIAAFLDRQGAVPSREETERGLLEREQAHSTAMGHGIAIPHATLTGLEDPLLSLAISREPIAFGPPESESVRVFFVLLSPPGRERDHIRLLARVCRLVRHPELVASLQEAPSGARAIEIIEGADAGYA